MSERASETRARAREKERGLDGQKGAGRVMPNAGDPHRSSAQRGLTVLLPHPELARRQSRATLPAAVFRSGCCAIRTTGFLIF